MARALLPLLTASLALAFAPLASADLPEIQKRGSLRALAVLSDEETYFVSQKAGQPPGFDIEVLEGFARLHRLKVELVPAAGWDALIPALLKGKGDVVAGGFTDTESRRRQIEFTAEVFPTRTVVMNRKPRPAIKSLDELRGEKVGTIKGTFMLEELQAAGITGVDDGVASGGLPEALKGGRITAGVDGLEAALVAQSRDKDLQLGAFLGKPSSLAYGVRKEDAALLRALNEYIGNLRKTPTWSRLVVKYFGEAAPEILRKARAQ
ncbi:MAG TPA: ABC transporter substrate-binding protein [Vicinamibacteria bacterium]|nr:ABC transporter substrate-binding protein [Vicinamibacteria bacterium]